MQLINSDLLIRAIISNGVSKIFLVPGGGCMIMQDAAIRSKELNPICFHSEQSAVLAAEFYGRNSPCGIGVAMVTTGPGVTNAVSSVTSAWLDSRPLIIIIGQVKTPDLKKNNDKIRSYGVQYVDSKNIFKGICKRFLRLKVNDNITDIVDKAFSIAKSNRPGPVIIEVPLDLQSKKVNEKKSASTKFAKIKYFLKSSVSKNNNERLIKKVFEKLNNSKRPILLVGSGCVIDGVNQKKIEELITQIQVPIANSWGSLELIEDNNKFYVGAPGTVGKRTANIIIKNSDFILAIGNRIDLATTAYAPEKFGEQVKDFFVVDIDKGELKFHKKLGRKTINSGAKKFINDFLIHIKKNKTALEISNLQRKEWIEFCNTIKNKYSSRSYTKYISEVATKEGWSTYDVVEDLSNLLDKNKYIVTGSSGHGVEVFYSYFRVKSNQRVFHSPGLGSMGFALGSAIGIALSDNLKKESRVTLIETDGSFNTNPQELGIIANLNLKIDIYIFNNNGYLSIRNGQNKSFGGRLSGVNEKSGLGCANLKLLCESYGIKYAKANNNDELKQIINSNSNQTIERPTLTELMISKSEELLPKCMPQKDEKGNITSMPIEDMTPLLKLNELEEIMKYKELSSESIKIRKRLIK